MVACACEYFSMYFLYDVDGKSPGEVGDSE